MTLIETISAMTLFTTIAVLGAQSVRIVWQSWLLQDQRSGEFQQLHGALAHITRHIRSARNVVSVSLATNTSGYLSITRPDGSVVHWRQGQHKIKFGTFDPPVNLLATDVNVLKFECFEIDGTTPTTVPADIRMIRTTVGISVPGPETPFSLSSTVWIRKQVDGVTAEYVDFYPSIFSAGGSWGDKNNLVGPVDGLLSYGLGGDSVDLSNCDTTGYTDTDPVGTVLVGFYLMTDGPLGEDVFDVQLQAPAVGPIHSFGESALLRFENNLDWFWVDLTDDLAGWKHADISGVKVAIANQDQGLGGTTIRADSTKIRTFVEAPLSQSYWMTSSGSTFNEWVSISNGVGAPDATFARSNIYSIPSADVDRQDYQFTPSWEDLGTIVSVKAAIVDFYMSAAVVDDRFHLRMPSTSEGSETMDTPAPSTAVEIPATLLNLHVGSGNIGSTTIDFSTLEDWSWGGLRSRFVRLYMTATDVPEAEIYVDGIRVDVRYVPPSSAAVVLWEEL